MSVTFGRKKKSFWLQILSLISHLAGGAAFCLSFAFIVWLVGWGLDWMNDTHPFAPGIYSLVLKVELYLVYIDIVVSSIVVVFSVWQYIRDVLEGK